MRRILYTLVASALLVAVVPATALGRSHHRRHHARSHHRIRHEQFGRTAAPTTTAPSDNAGMVTAFDPATGKLTIQLNSDNSTVTGTVNGDTQIECNSADTSNMQGDIAFRKNDHGGGGDNGDNNDQGDNNDHGDNNDQGDNDDNNAQNCSTADLTPGAVVHEAELRLSGAGATWDKVELVTSSSSSSSSGNSSGD